METCIRAALANELRTLRKVNENEPQPPYELINVLVRHHYVPEEFSDTDNRAIWTDLIHHAVQYGITPDVFARALNVSSLELQQWMNGVCMPQRTAMRKDLYQAIVELLIRRHRDAL